MNTQKKYQAISLDTSIFDRCKLKLNSGILSHLKQFKSNHAELIITDVVLKEVLAHLKVTTNRALDNLNSPLQSLAKRFSLTNEEREILTPEVKAINLCEKLPQTEIEKFIFNTGANIIQSNNVYVSDLVEMYFNTKPPFENNPEKKAEFPDAIALLSLEKWAVDNNKNILVVSNDKGWLKFSEESDNLDVINDLASALEIFNRHDEEIRKIVDATLENIHQSKEVEQFVIDSIAEKVAESDVDLSIDAGMYYEIDEVYAEYGDFSFVIENGKFSYKLINVSDNEIAIGIDVKINVTIHGSVTFKIRDSIDKDYVPLGGNSLESNTDTFEKVIMQISYDNGGNSEIEDISLSNGLSVDIGYIEPYYEE